MATRSLRIIISESNIRFKNRYPTVEEFFQIMYSAILQFMNRTLADFPQDQQERVQAALYDMANRGAYNMLDRFWPGRGEWHEDLTAQAVLRCENEIIKERYEALPEAEKIEKTKALQKWMREFAERNGLDYDETRFTLETEGAVLPQEPEAPMEEDRELDAKVREAADIARNMAMAKITVIEGGKSNGPQETVGDQE
jgi:hypothetical protein